MTAVVVAFPECLVQATALAAELGVDCRPVVLHTFPDAESLVRVPEVAETVLLYRSLDHPNEKIFELLLAASALRARGAGRVVLVIPYLAYMRQDRAFQLGEAVSQQVLGELLAAACDALVTVDPHLHRSPSLGALLPGIEAIAVSAASALGEALRGTGIDLLVGPDAESRQWVEAVAEHAGLPFILGTKRRRADRSVTLAIADAACAQEARVMLVDDMVSSGGTLLAAAEILSRAGAYSVAAMATHCLASREDLRALAAGGITLLRATQTIPGPVATLPVAGVLADAIRRHGLCPDPRRVAPIAP